MKFDWRYFAKEDYEKIRVRNPESKKELDYLGSVWVGDIAIDLVNRYYGDGKNHLDYDLYVGHEDTGYGYKSIPYDYADGGGFYITEDISYEEFKVIAEKEFEEFIKVNSNGKWESGLSLLDHANKPLEIWY